MNNLDRFLATLEHASRTYVVQFSSQRRLKLNPTKQNSSGWTEPHAIGKLSQQPRLRMTRMKYPIKFFIGPRFGNDYRLWLNPGDSYVSLSLSLSLLARNCFYQLRRIRQAKKCLDEFNLVNYNCFYLASVVMYDVDLSFIVAFYLNFSLNSKLTVNI